MATAEERRKVLEMVAKGEMSAVEAAELLAATESAVDPAPAGETNPAPPTEPEAPTTPLSPDPPAVPDAKPVAEENGKKSPSWLHVRVEDLRSGQRKVSVNIPLRVVKLGMRLGGGFVPELHDLDWDELDDLVEEGGSGILVDVQDEEDGEHVQIYVD